MASTAVGSQEIWSDDIISEGGFNIAQPPDFPYHFELISIPTDDVGLFANIVLSKTVVGTTFISDEASDPRFAETVAAITDGIEQAVSEWTYFGGGWGSLIAESVFFGSVSGGGGIDLAGFRIDYFSLTLNSFSVETPGRDPNHDGIWTNLSMTLSVSAFGDLPGDANEDDLVDGADYTAWADHFLQTDQTWATGDFTGDGLVDGEDYTIWADHFAPGPLLSLSAVPEPSTLALAGIGALALIAVAARRRTTR